MKLSHPQPCPAADRASAEAFIRANTRLISPPLLPEIQLHLAEESLPIWQKAEQELGELNVPPPYWAFAWAGGQALARYLLDNPQLVKRKRVLDLGSGSGLSAIAAKKAGAVSVLAADIDTVAVAAIGLNAAANAIAIETTEHDLLAAGCPGMFDVILLGDLFYERELASRVLTFIEAVPPHSTLILLGDPQRNYFPTDRFEVAAEYHVPVTRELEDAEIKKTAVWRCSKVY